MRRADVFVREQKKLDVPPSDFIIGAKKEGEEDGGDLDDDAQICSCHVRSSSLSCKTLLTRFSNAERPQGSYRSVHQGGSHRPGADQVQDQGWSGCVFLALVFHATGADSILLAGCGGCVPLVTNIYKAEMKKAGHATNNKCIASFARRSTRADSRSQPLRSLQDEPSRPLCRRQDQEASRLQHDHGRRWRRSQRSRMRDLQARRR